MFGLKFFKADSSSFVIKSINGEARRVGKGISFWYYKPTTTVAVLPVNSQEAPFIFNLQTSDFQSLRVQGQVSFLIQSPEITAGALNYSLAEDGKSYVSEDPMKLNDRVLRVVQTIIQNHIQQTKLRESLLTSEPLLELLQRELVLNESLKSLGVEVMDVSIAAITPSPETAKALEAEARESILKEADDAIYARRKFSVEQERTIREAELDTDLSVQQKEQELEEARMENQKQLLREQAAIEQERLQSEVDAETKRQELVALSAQNQRIQAEADAYTISEKMKAYRELPVESLRAMALAQMTPEQLMATAFESFAVNANKIGELNISPDLISQFAKQVAR
ncbi:SPFH domain-containing protein [Alteromonas sp. KUL49]|uniref:SPFH domain-containing protein n=1 Tax=Alteromonas sp. KUL49 TaxID=2480798 RepID=UPI00102ED720|nr:SPFH domain-containing protein [Alteromonas sp. KUL49]TAP33591.1 NrtR-regulated NrtX [Alteromonas sp. KUL49]GEA13724.1 hypothetical protein KUL49_40990 [Alteromonas sp. KUL49]